MSQTQQNDDSMVIGSIGSFTYSGMRPDYLTSTNEYTLVSIVLDISGSVGPFSKELGDCLTSIVQACRRSPRSENLLITIREFNQKVHEKQGFMPLKDTDVARLLPIRCSGTTALFDAMYASIGGANAYAAQHLFPNDFLVNAITFIITDGEDNASRMTGASIKKELETMVKEEKLESHITILIGVNMTSSQAYLDKVKTSSGLTQMINAGDADEKTLARLAQFVSKSISSQSQSLGSGGPSQTISF